jgi:hypothetical protein
MSPRIPDRNAELYNLFALVIVVLAAVILLVTGTRAEDLSIATLAMSNLYARWASDRKNARYRPAKSDDLHP